jgi:glycosyltransferase involved in cell wall biosynthesis
VYRQLERVAARWCRTIVTLSAAERDAGRAAGVGRGEQYRVIPNGVELERFALPRRPVPGRIVMVGRLGPPKRPDLAIRALARVVKRLPAAHLQLVGDGPLRSGAERLARDLGVDGAVEFLGARDDVPALLAEAACAILASDYEGCPLAVIEAMAAAVPVVATAAGGIDELVADGRTGFVSPADDSEALAARIEDVLLDSELARRLGVEGGRVARERLSVRHMVGELVSLYDEVTPTKA